MTINKHISHIPKPNHNTRVCMHMQAYTHLFNVFTSPVQSQIFPLIKSSSLFILLRCTLQQLIASRAQLHLEWKNLVSVFVLGRLCQCFQCVSNGKVVTKKDFSCWIYYNKIVWLNILAILLVLRKKNILHISILHNNGFIIMYLLWCKIPFCVINAYNPSQKLPSSDQFKYIFSCKLNGGVKIGHIWYMTLWLRTGY